MHCCGTNDRCQEDEGDEVIACLARKNDEKLLFNYLVQFNLLLFRVGSGSNPSRRLLPKLLEKAGSVYGRTASAHILDGLAVKAQSRSISICDSTIKCGLKHEPEYSLQPSIVVGLAAMSLRSSLRCCFTRSAFASIFEASLQGCNVLCRTPFVFKIEEKDSGWSIS